MDNSPIVNVPLGQPTPPVDAVPPPLPTVTPEPQQAQVFSATEPVQPTPVPPASTSTQPEIEPPEHVISWTASEFIAHSKNKGWYVVLAAGALVAAAIVFLLTRDKITTGMIIIATILFGIMASRKPRELQYQIDDSALVIGDKVYNFADFKSFSLVQEEGVQSIWFMPMQRFMPGLSIYFAPEDEQRIFETLDDILPLENRQLDFIDKLMHRIRF